MTGTELRFESIPESTVLIFPRNHCCLFRQSTHLWLLSQKKKGWNYLAGVTLHVSTRRFPTSRGVAVLCPFCTMSPMTENPQVPPCIDSLGFAWWWDGFLSRLCSDPPFIVVMSRYRIWAVQCRPQSALLKSGYCFNLCSRSHDQFRSQLPDPFIVNHSAFLWNVLGLIAQKPAEPMDSGFSVFWEHHLRLACEL